jgi:hypothetical protein
MFDILAQATLGEYAAVSGSTLAILATIIGLWLKFKPTNGNGNGKRTPDTSLHGERIAKLEVGVDAMRSTLQSQSHTISRIAENTDEMRSTTASMHGMVKMLPCVRGEKAACTEG